MSGIEVVGVVLAVIPLFISAAEHYREGLHALDRMRNKDKVLQRYIEDLCFQRTLLGLILEGLLGRVNLELSIREELLADPSSQTWRNSHVIRKIEEGLGLYDSIVTVLNRIAVALVGQLKDEGIITPTADGKAVSNEQPSKILEDLLKKQQARKVQGTPTELYRCLKFSQQQARRDEMLTEIKECNKDLQTLLTAIQGAEPFRKEHRRRLPDSVFLVRKMAQDLYDILSSSCNCQSNSCREAHLCLRRCNGELRSRDDAYFELWLLQSPTVYCQARIRIHEKSETNSTISRVQINLPPDLTNSAQNQVLLHDICAAMARYHARKMQLNLLIDQEHILWEVPSNKNLINAQSAKSFPLSTYLTEFTKYANKQWLLKEKAILAVVLAHSLLQLHDSSWLERTWSTKHIFFLREDNQDNTHPSRFSLERPHVSRRISRGNPDETNDTPKASQISHPEPSLLSLGTILLELHLNASIESASGPSDGVGPRDRVSQLFLGTLDNVTMDPRYYNAIGSCMYLTPAPSAGTRLSLDDAGFRDWYYQRVIVPLEDYLSEKFEIDRDE